MLLVTLQPTESSASRLRSTLPVPALSGSGAGTTNKVKPSGNAAFTVDKVLGISGDFSVT
jgi:hypothetical protein